MEREEEVLSPRRREEKNFFELFYKVLTLMKEGRKATDQNIVKGIQKVIDGFTGGPQGVCDAGNFQSVGDELGYFYWSSPVSACVTRVKTLAAFRNCEEFRSLFRQSSLQMVSVGAGTGSDLVSLYSAIHRYMEESDETLSEETQLKFQSMNILLMDNNSKWKKFFLKVDKLLRDANLDFGNASQLMRSRNITTSFLQADLKNLSADQRQEFSNADIVWMKGIQSIQKTDEHRELIVENIVSSMTVGALLVVLDSPFYKNFVTSNEQLKEIYKTEDPIYFHLEPFPDHPDKYRYCRKTNQQLIILKKISNE